MSNPPNVFGSLTTAQMSALDANFNAGLVTLSSIATSAQGGSTTASLRSNTQTYLIQVYVKGYYKDYDGGEGIFILNPGDTTSIDNGGTIIVDAVSQRWYRVTGGQDYSVKWFGAKGDAATDDAGAIANAQTAALLVSAGIVFPVGRYAVASNVVLTASCGFLKGGILQPAIGITITLTGAVTAGAYQIIDTANGIVDMTGIAGGIGFVEWTGVVAGDPSFNAAHAATNKPRIDYAFLYLPTEVWFKTKGIYSTTGHVLTGNKGLNIVGPGINGFFASGGASITNGIIGSGLPFSDAANMPATEPASTTYYVFQNGQLGNAFPTVFNGVCISVTSTQSACPLGILMSSTSSLNWQINTFNCGFAGYYAKHLSYQTGNIHQGNQYIGNGTSGAGAAILMTVANFSGPAGPPAVQKAQFSSCILNMTSSASGTLIYQDNHSPNLGIGNLQWDNCDVEFGFNGFRLNGFNQVFTNTHCERIANTVITGESGSGGTFKSMWLNPQFAMGGGQPAVGIGPNSIVFASNTIIIGQNSSAGGAINIGNANNSSAFSVGAMMAASVFDLTGVKSTGVPHGPGAASASLVWQAGTAPGTAKLVAFAGLSSTGVTVVDNVGAGF